MDGSPLIEKLDQVLNLIARGESPSRVASLVRIGNVVRVSGRGNELFEITSITPLPSILGYRVGLKELTGSLQLECTMYSLNEVSALEALAAADDSAD